MSKRVAMTLVLMSLLTGSAGAQDPQGVEVRGPSEAGPKRPAEPGSRLAADRTKQAGEADLRRRAAAAPQGRARPTRKLTVRQKRLFVLGLWAAEKK